jgi:hypothetical protein
MAGQVAGRLGGTRLMRSLPATRWPTR